jgi:NAD(P)H-dependent flavin oxidoreductase YrpB (nitropropane dioxygenase family)
VHKAEFLDRLRLPLMAAPISIASTPELVMACSRAGRGRLLSEAQCVEGGLSGQDRR